MVPVKFYLHNLGKDLDNCKISLWPITDGVEFHKSNEKRNSILGSIDLPTIHDLIIDDAHHIAYKKLGNALNPADQPFVGEVYLRICPDITDLKIHWVVSARQLMKPCEGDLNISVVPAYEYESGTSATKTGETIEEWEDDISD